MRSYREFNPKLLPLTYKECNKKLVEVLSLIKASKDEELNDRVMNLFQQKSRRNALWVSYFNLGLIGLFYTRYKFYRPHAAGIMICLGFSYFLGYSMSITTNNEQVISEIGETSHPVINEEIHDFVLRCKVARNIA